MAKDPKITKGQKQPRGQKGKFDPGTVEELTEDELDAVHGAANKSKKSTTRVTTKNASIVIDPIYVFTSG